MKNKKVLFIANDFDIVIFRFRKEVIQSFVENYFDVVLAVPFSKGAVEFSKKYGIKLVLVDIDRRGTNLLKDLSLLFKYVQIMRLEKPDYVFTATIKPNLYLGLVNLFFKKKFFPWVTGLGSVFHYDNFLTRVIEMLYRWSFITANKVFFENAQNMKLLAEKRIVKSEKAIVLPGCGINLEEFRLEPYPSEDDGLKFIFVGRIMREKGVYELVDAFEALQEKFSNISLMMYGPKDDRVDDLLEKIKTINNVVYEGVSADIYEVIKKSHIFVLPSYHEGLSVALMEAASVGRPVLASNISGCNEVINDGISGLVFEPQNVDSLRLAIEKIIGMSLEQRKVMGLNGRKKIEKEFDRRIVVEEYLKCLRGVE